MDITTAIAQVLQSQDLSEQQMLKVMQSIMTGQATSAQIAGLLVALRMKGETVAEITGAAKAMKALATQIPSIHAKLVDIVGTGGDGAGIFNVSTAAAFVVAAAGGAVAKHGNRSFSSTTGSADVLEAAGVNLQITPEHLVRSVEQLNIGFLFGPNFHPAMKYAQTIRKELKVRTLFNLLGPLTNPAGVRHQVIGVFQEQWLLPVAQVLQQLGSEHSLIVHSVDGLDEISIAAPTDVVELKQGQIYRYQINPQDFHMTCQSLDLIKVDNAQQSLQMILSVFANEPGPARDMVALNAGAALYAADLVDHLALGAAKALDVIASGKASEKFQQYIRFSQSL